MDRLKKLFSKDNTAFEMYKKFSKKDLVDDSFRNFVEERMLVMDSMIENLKVENEKFKEVIENVKEENYIIKEENYSIKEEVLENRRRIRIVEEKVKNIKSVKGIGKVLGNRINDYIFVG